MASTSSITVTESPDTYKTQMQIPRRVWDEMKIQAARETMTSGQRITAGQLACKAFLAYLETVGVQVR